MQSSADSFVRSVIGFLFFICLSFGITFIVNSYATRRDQAAALQKAQTAALGAMLHQVQ